MPRREDPVVGGDEGVAERRRGSSPRSSATQAAVTRTHSGSLRPRGAPGGERNGESVSTRSRSAGYEADDVGGRLLARPERQARDADRRAELEHRLGVVERAAERVDDDRAAASPPNARSSREERVLGVALARPRPAVEDRRLAGLGGEREVPAEVRELGEDRREDPVVVEARSRRSRRRADRAAERRDRRPRRRRRRRPRRGDGRRPRHRATGTARRASSAAGRRPGVPARDEDPLDARLRAPRR